MDEINHRTVNINGLNMHIAEKGEKGPIILFLHGFPELWYSWRHQIVALASLGYRAVAPDLRGFGGTDSPADAKSYTTLHIVGDIIGLIDEIAGNDEKVFVVAHDWGAYFAWHLCMYRPERVKAMEPGQIEGEFAELGTETVIKAFLTLRHPGPLFLPKGNLFGLLPDTPIVLPSWLTEEDVKYYTSQFEKTGFTAALNYYRNLDLNWELNAPWTGAQVKVPVKFIVGDLDLTYNSLNVKDYIHKGAFKKDVPFLEEVVVLEGVAHFLNQEKPEEIIKHIYDFVKKF